MITDFEYHNSTALGEGLYITDDIEIPVPVERYTEYTIPGRDGSLIYKEGSYPDMEIEISLSFLEKPDDVNRRFSDIKRWLLLGEGNRLKLSSQHDSYYLVRRIEIKENKRKYLIKGEFSVVFTVHPYQYPDDSETPIALVENLYNPYYLAHPIYIITPTKTSSVFRMDVNDNEIKVQVTKTTTIDTERMITYTEDGINNTLLTGDYDWLYLQPGYNFLNTKSGFDVTIIPNWRFI